MLFKSRPVAVKAGPDDGLKDGQFTALVSVFGNRDCYGDVVMPGAFADDLKAWEASGSPIPVYWSHQMSDPDMNLGHVLEAQETDAGLQVTAQLDLENPKAAQVYRLMKGRRVTQFSFAYDVIDGGWGERDGEEVYELRAIKLHEVGPTPVGANDATELLAVKNAGERAVRLAAEIKAGRTISAKNEDLLRTAHESIGTVLSAIGDESKAKAGEPANAEEPPGANAEEPTRFSPVALDALERDLNLAALAL